MGRKKGRSKAVSQPNGSSLKHEEMEGEDVANMEDAVNVEGEADMDEEANMEDVANMEEEAKDEPLVKKKKSEKCDREQIKRRLERKQRRREALLSSLEKKSKFEETLTPIEGGRQYTVSIALPASILDNAQSNELRTYLAGQVARALAVFNIDEVILFDDQEHKDDETTETCRETTGQLCRLLRYLECPQYLRRSFFPLHSDLRFAGLLNPTDMPHHLRSQELYSAYREGVVVDEERTEGKGSFVYVGLKKHARIDKVLDPGTRVTVKMGKETNTYYKGVAVSPHRPRMDSALYWGYNVRVARRLSDVFKKCPFRGGKYDLTVGTSERGSSVDVCSLTHDFKHLLVVFGGVQGLEVAASVDNKLESDFDVSSLFDHYLNTCPRQGSRTIRTEEAILISMAALRPKINEAQTKPPLTS